MGFERPENPEDEARQAKAFFDTLGPVLLTRGYESLVTAVREEETGRFVPAILLRFEGRINGTTEPATSTLMLAPSDAEHLVQMIAEQTVIARNAPMPPDDWQPGESGG